MSIQSEPNNIDESIPEELTAVIQLFENIDWQAVDEISVATAAEIQSRLISVRDDLQEAAPMSDSCDICQSESAVEDDVTQLALCEQCREDLKSLLEVVR